MKKVFVADLKEREQIDCPFLVRDKIMAMAKNGKPYMTLKLMDRSGEVEGRVWDRVDEFDRQFKKNDFIRIRAKGSVYMGKMQLIVQDLQFVPEDSIDLGDFLPVSQNDPQQMLTEVRALVASMSDPHLKSLLEAFLADDEFICLYAKAPAAKAMHHVYLGGLLEHSLAVARLAADISPRYPKINLDLLVSDALLHDIGKVAELRYARSFDYSDEGKLLGHIVIGVEMVEDKIRTLSEFPRMKRTLIKHLLLSHHGQYDYGSPKRPKTLEAVVLNFLDDMDSKINGVQTHIEKEQHSETGWTSYHRLYDRYFFIGDSADNAAPAVDSPVSVQSVSIPVSIPITNTPEPSTTVVEPPTKAPTQQKSAPKSRQNSHHNTPLSNNLEQQLSGLNFDLFGTKEEQ